MVSCAIQGGGVGTIHILSVPLFNHKEQIMNYYLIAKFVHIVGALGMFVALGVEWLSLRNLRQAASITQVHEWARIARGVQRLGGVSMVAILISGFYMMAVARFDAAWLVVAFGSLILLGLLAGIVTGRRMAIIQRSISKEIESISPLLYQLLHQPLLWIVIQLRVAVVLGIVFLMTVKPDLTGSLLTMSLATILGLVSALPTLRREQANEAGRELHHV
jgi:hypothetical protein